MNGHGGLEVLFGVDLGLHGELDHAYERRCRSRKRAVPSCPSGLRVPGSRGRPSTASRSGYRAGVYAMTLVKGLERDHRLS